MRSASCPSTCARASCNADGSMSIAAPSRARLTANATSGSAARTAAISASRPCAETSGAGGWSIFDRYGDEPSPPSTSNGNDADGLEQHARRGVHIERGRAAELGHARRVVGEHLGRRVGDGRAADRGAGARHMRVLRGVERHGGTEVDQAGIEITLGQPGPRPKGARCAA